MAYNIVRASGQRINLASAFSSTGVQTVHFSYNLKNIPSSNSFPNRYRLFVSSSNTNVFCPYIVLSQNAIAHGYYDGSNYREQSSAITNTVGSWVDVVHVWDFSTVTASLKLYINGSQLGSTYTVSRGTVNTQALMSLGGDGTAETADAHFADFGFWNTELTMAEIIALSRGYSCEKIRPQSLLRDVSLVRNLQDLRLSTSVTSMNNPEVSPHPRIYQ